jgi:hypothetical protein
MKIKRGERIGKKRRTDCILLRAAAFFSPFSLLYFSSFLRVMHDGIRNGHAKKKETKNLRRNARHSIQKSNSCICFSSQKRKKTTNKKKMSRD